MKNKYEIDMLHGPLMPKIVTYFAPLMLSTILQLLFNAVDLVVVGRFTGSNALAAVGATSSLIALLTNLFIGTSIGANVVAARYIAVGDAQSTRKTVHTAILTALIAGFLLIIVGRFASRPALQLMDTPDTIIDMSVIYMQIYFCGMPFFMLYNFGAAILRATGDTKRPLIFLIVAGVLNACLNVILVTVFRLGVVGVAAATVFSQMVSCVLVIRCLMKSDSIYRLQIKYLAIDGHTLLQICRIGIPAGLQSMLINFSNVLLQSSVNSLGENAMAGYTAANNMMAFLYAAENSISQACMTFTSQNMAARQADRMKRILLDGLVLEVLVGGTLGGLATLFGTRLLGIYNSDAAVIACGMELLPETYLLYFICGWMDCMPSILRGMGHSAIPMFLSLIGTVGTRVTWVFAFFPLHRNLQWLFVCYPVSWVVTFLLNLICYAFVAKRTYASLAGPDRLQPLA